MGLRMIKFRTKGNIMQVMPLRVDVVNIVDRMASFTMTVSGNGHNAFQKVPLFAVNKEHGYIETFSGLESRLKAEFHRQGYEVSVERLFVKKLEADSSRLSQDDLANLDGRDDQIEVLGMIVDSETSFIVQAPTGWGKSYVIRQLCQMLPNAKIAIVVPGIELVEGMYTIIKKRVRDVGAVSGFRRTISRITVCTIDSIRKLKGIDWDLLLFDEVHKAGAKDTSNAIVETFPLAKCVGFSASPTGRSDNADLVVEALFGSVKYKVSYNEGVDRGVVTPIKVMMYRVQGGNNGAVYTKSVVRNRHGLWRNSYRNSLIAAICSELIPEEDQALIIVATAEHALHLHALLPTWAPVFTNISRKHMANVVKGVLPWPEGLNASGQMMYDHREKMRKNFESGKLLKAIATGIWNTGVDFCNLKWLIRADGMASSIQSIQTPGRLSRLADGKEYGLLVDFMDEFEPALKRRAQARRRMYKNMGWSVEMIDIPGEPAQMSNMRDLMRTTP